MKLIFLDIDGTLTEPGCNTPPHSALDAIQKARKKGNKVFLCSGRNYNMLSPLLQYGFDGAVASSGGYIVCDEKLIYDKPMTEQQRERAMDIFDKNGVFLTIECADGSYTDERFKEFLREHSYKKENSEMLRWRRQIESELNIRPLGEYQGQPVYKMVFMSLDMKSLEQPRLFLEKEFAFCIQNTNLYGIVNGELVNRAFDKGRGIKKICEYLGVSIADTVAFGDSMNDMEMMQTASFSVCMENGCDALKKEADDICPSVEKDGLAKAFEKYSLC